MTEPSSSLDEKRKDLTAWLAEQEQGRIDVLHKRRRRAWILGPCLIIIAGLLFFFAVPRGLAPDLIFFIVIAGGFGAYAYAQYPVSQFKKKIKVHVLSGLAVHHGLKYFASPVASGAHRPFRTLDLVPSYDSAKSEDYFEGAVDGVDLNLFECKLTEQRGSSKNRRTVTVFHGILSTFSFPKAFHGTTVISTDAGIFNWAKSLGNKGERVRLEDPRFEKTFEVFSTDQVEARYLLTPTFMERLMKLRSAFGGAKLQAAFEAKTLHISIDVRKPLFEIRSLKEPLAENGTLQSFEEELTIFRSMIDTLKLNAMTRV